MIGEITEERLGILREADRIILEEIKAAEAAEAEESEDAGVEARSGMNSPEDPCESSLSRKLFESWRPRRGARA